MDKKLTDSEIVKALDEAELFLRNRTMDGMSLKLNEYDIGILRDISQVCAKAYDEINRQKAEIEKLTSGKCVYLSDDETTEYCVEGPCPNYKTVAQIKAEAYKEFVNKIKVHAYYIDFPKEHRVVDEDDIDNLLKEMEGDSNAEERQ